MELKVWSNLRLLNHHVGGLEEKKAVLTFMVLVNHHVGGLEVPVCLFA